MRFLVRRPEATLNMTPMIDVVFLLIIFFLVSSHLAQQETQLDLNLPQAGNGTSPLADRRNRVTVNLLSDGRLLLGAEQTTPAALETKLRYEQQRAKESLEVCLRADRQVPFALVEPVLVACAKARVWNVTFAVHERER